MLAKLTARKYAFTAISLLFTFVVFGQRAVTGKVFGPDKQPIYGATVSIKGTNVATVTANDGSFSITVPNDRSVLVISNVGYKTVETRVGTSTDLSMSLELATSNLDEVVVTGYTAQKRKEITGSVSVVNVKDLKSIPAGSAEQMLQGQAAGVNVISSGSPGNDNQLYIRGITNFGSVYPLIIIDGVPGNFSNLNPSDIESLQVLKDANAAIYGAAGANGVIIITTKRGRAGKAVITYESYVGTQRPPSGNVWDKLNVQEMADLYFLAAKNSGQVNPDTVACPGCVVSAQYGTGLTPVIPEYLLIGSANGLSREPTAAELERYNVDYAKGDIYQIIKANKEGTDWFHEVFKPAMIQNHSLTASGGGDKSSYLFSVNYFNQQGSLLNTYLKRYAARMNTSFNIKNNIRVGENAYVFYRDNPRITNNGEGNEVSMTAWEQPIIPVYDINGGFAGTRPSELGNSGTPVAARVTAKDNKGNEWNITGNVWGEVDFLKHFTARTSFGGIIQNGYWYNYSFHSYWNRENNSSNGFTEGSYYNSSWTWTNSVTYSNVFAQVHSVKAFAATEAKSYYGRWMQAGRLGYFTDDPNYRALNTGASSQTNSGSPNTKATVASLLGRIDYAYDEKYLLQGNIRQDRSSNLGPGTNNTGLFGSVSLGWRLSREDFMKSIAWISDLKLRASWAQLGNLSNVVATNAFNLYGSTPGNSYDLGGTSTSTVSGFYATQYANAVWEWESDQIINFGIDGSFFKNKFDMSLEWYRKDVDGLLFQDQAGATAGAGSLPFVNIARSKTTGIDFNGTYRDKIGKDFSFSVGANITTYKSTVINIPGTRGSFESGGTRLGNVVLNSEGNPIGSFYGYQIIGFFQDENDAKGSPVQTDAKAGRFKYADIDRNDTINDKDRTIIGNPNPKFTYGINLSAQYKQFDFSMMLYGSQGNDIFNYGSYFMDFVASFQNAKSKDALYNSWTPSNTNARLPIAENLSTFSTNGVTNSYFIDNGSYLRCKQIQIGYNFVPSMLQKAGIDKARLYVQAANLFTITKYRGLDPELAGAATAFGIDYGGNYPPIKTYIVGISVTF